MGGTLAILKPGLLTPGSFHATEFPRTGITESPVAENSSSRQLGEKRLEATEQCPIYSL